MVDTILGCSPNNKHVNSSLCTDYRVIGHRLAFGNAIAEDNFDYLQNIASITGKQHGYNR